MDFITFETPFGPMSLLGETGAITGLRLPGQAAPTGTPREGPVLTRARAQLLEYLGGTRREFDLPLAPVGTAFQRAVWAVLRAIPYSETRTYAQIAADLGRPTAVRAVGGANHRNPIAIFIPCHRVVGADGSLTGYAGGLELKRKLLELEGASR